MWTRLATQVGTSPPLLDALKAAVAALPKWYMPPVLLGEGTLQLEAEWLVLGLVADRQARTAFTGVLDGGELAGIEAATTALAARQLDWINEQIQPFLDPELCDDLMTRLGRLADASTKPGRQRPAPLSITTQDELVRYLSGERRTETTARGLKKARLESGLYQPWFDDYLREAGYDVVVIENPSVAELDQLDESHGMYLVPPFIRCATRPRLEADFIRGLEPVQRRNKMKSMLSRSAAVPVVVGPLTRTEFTQWHGIYAAEVLAKPGAVEIYALDFIDRQHEAGRLGLWHRMFLTDPASQALIGGALIAEYVERGHVSIAGLACRHEFRQLELPRRIMVEVQAFALARGWDVVSYGSDWNFFGYDMSLGLLHHKLSLALTPFPDGRFELLKVLDTQKLAAITNTDGKRPGYYFFSVRRDSPLWQRVRAARTAGMIPEAHIALGGQYFSATCLRPQDNLIANHFYGDEGIELICPTGMELARRPMAR